MEFADELKETSNMILLLGPAKSGKTTAAATASRYYPEKFPIDKKVYLKDMVWAQFDTNGISSLLHSGVVPYIEDMSKEINYANFHKRMRQLIDDMKKKVDEGVKFLVIDTITTMDSMVLNHLKTQYNDPKLTGIMYNQLLGIHMDIAMRLKQLPLTVIVIAHTKVNGMGSMSDAADLSMRKKASAMPGQADIVAEITGKAANYYKGQSDMVAPVLQLQDGKHWILPYGGFGFEGGGRYPVDVLEDKEPAHLGKLLQKIAYIEKKESTNV